MVCSNDPRPGKADERARLGDVDVVQHGVRGGGAAGGRVGQHDDVGLARRPQLLHRDSDDRHRIGATPCSEVLSSTTLLHTAAAFRLASHLLYCFSNCWDGLLNLLFLGDPQKHAA